MLCLRSSTSESLISNSLADESEFLSEKIERDSEPDSNSISVVNGGESSRIDSSYGSRLCTLSARCL